MDINVMNTENKCNCVKHECNNKDDYTKDGHTCEGCFMDCVEIMTTYKFRVEQVICVKANSLEEAEDSLPSYPNGFKGQVYYVENETVEQLKEVQNGAIVWISME